MLINLLSGDCIYFVELDEYSSGTAFKKTTTFDELGSARSIHKDK